MLAFEMLSVAHRREKYPVHCYGNKVALFFARSIFRSCTLRVGLDLYENTKNILDASFETNVVKAIL
jgi:hypothetical protein